MLETLAGRLKWERTDGGIRVRIPGRVSLWLILNSILIGCSAFLLIFVPTILLGWLILYLKPHPHSHHLPIDWWSHFLSLVAACPLGLLIARLANKTNVLLNPTHLRIDHSQGWRNTKIFATSSLSNLRFVRYSRSAGIRNDLRANEIQFEADRITQSFAAGITEVEATALIARMMEVYPFPRTSLCA